MAERSPTAVAPLQTPARASPAGWAPDPGPFPLQIRGLGFLRGRRVVLRDLDLALSSGELVALLGSNGVGKTTLLHCLAGALRPTAGEVLWFGSPAARSPAARRLVGLLAHESGLYLNLTAWENLLFPARLCGLDQAPDRVAGWLSAVGLERYAQQQVGELSRGMRQRLAIARAIIHDPPILLLDEPFTSLDAGGRDWLVILLNRLRAEGRAILLTSHDPGRSRGLADRLMELQAGRLHRID